VLLPVAALTCLAFASGGPQGGPVSPAFTPLPPTLVSHMDRQRTFVAQLVARHFPGDGISRTRSDFALLQRILDAKLISREKTWELQALGVVFGDALAATVEGLAWWQVTDEYGTDPTLRFRDTTIQVNALTMLSKRIEDGKGVDVADLARSVTAYLAERRAKAN